MLLDAHATSQINNRKLKTLSADFNIKNQNAELLPELTWQLKNTPWLHEIIGYIIDSIFYGYTLIELDLTTSLDVKHIPRQNVIASKGLIVYDYNQSKSLDFVNTPQYGTWLLDFGAPNDIGLINKAIPHILFSRFAQSCWSELCEIYGIPPRVMKTNTQDPSALRRAEKMMADMGAAAWFIIDETENFEFAPTSAGTNGEVYSNLIHLCRDNISLLFSGAVLGQDTKFGSRSKEQSAQQLLQELVNADQTFVEQTITQKVFPALYKIGVLGQPDLQFTFDQTEDVSELWKRTIEILPYKEIDNNWIKDKFGIEVTQNKNQEQSHLSLDFFD